MKSWGHGLSAALFCAALAGCSDPPAPMGVVDAAVTDRGEALDVGSDAGPTPADAQAPVDVVVPVDVQAPVDVVAPSDVQAPVDVVTPADVQVPVDVVVPVDAGPLPLSVTGEFVGGAATGSAGGIALVGHFHWNAVVSGSSGGITLEGVLR